MLDEEARHRNATLLARVGLLKHIPADALAVLAEELRSRTFHAGGVLVCQGKVSGVLFLLLKGTVRVERRHPQFLNPVALVDLTAGATVGEEGLLQGAAQTVTAWALEDTETLELSASAISQALGRCPGGRPPSGDGPGWRSSLLYVAAHGAREDAFPAVSAPIDDMAPEDR